MILKGSNENGAPKTAAIDERIGSLFQPDTLLGEDYAANFRRKLPLKGRRYRTVTVKTVAGHPSEASTGAACAATTA